MKIQQVILQSHVTPMFQPRWGPAATSIGILLCFGDRSEGKNGTDDYLAFLLLSSDWSLHCVAVSQFSYYAFSRLVLFNYFMAFGKELKDFIEYVRSFLINTPSGIGSRQTWPNLRLIQLNQIYTYGIIIYRGLGIGTR